MTTDMLAGLKEAISLGRAAREASVCPPTVFRWATIGVRGAVLESWMVGGRRKTTLAALNRFLAKLNGQPVPSPDGAPAPGTDRAVERAEAEAAALGLV